MLLDIFIKLFLYILKIKNILYIPIPCYKYYLTNKFYIINFFNIFSCTLQYYIYKIYTDTNYIYHITNNKISYTLIRSKQLLLYNDNIDIDNIKYINIYLISRKNNIKYNIIFSCNNNNIIMYNILLYTTVDSIIYPILYYYLQYYLNIYDIIYLIEIKYIINNNMQKIIKINKTDTINHFINNIIE